MSLNQPDLDLLADYVGGALDGTPDEERVGERIRSDAAWARAYADLVAAFGDVSSDLRAFGAEPEPMPQDVWDRLEAALSAPDSANQLASASPPSTPIFTAPRDNRPPARAASRRRRWAVPVLAAVAVLFALSFGLVLTHPFVGRENSATDTSGGAPAPAAARPPVLERASGRDYTDASLVLATDFGSKAFSSSSKTTTDGHFDSGAEPQRSFTSPVPTPLTPLTSPDALARCLDAVVAILPGQVVGVDYASYRRTPALIVVIRAADDSRWVGVAAANCGQSGAHLLAQKHIG